MSWNVSGKGKASQLDNELALKFVGIDYLQGDERKLKELAENVVTAAVSCYEPDAEVAVESYGSSSTIDGKTFQVLHIDVRPFWGSPSETENVHT